MRKVLLLIIVLMLSVINVFAVTPLESDTYNLIQGDSVFVVDVEWQKIGDTDDYNAYFTVDLNYNELMNPVDRFAIVESYQWRNWFNPVFEVDDIGYSYYFDDEFGNQIETFILYYYDELMASDGVYEEEVNSQIGFYGLPFTIQEVEFWCDVDNYDKGHYYTNPNIDDFDSFDTYSLIRPAYEGLPSPDFSSDLPTVPMGWITSINEKVSYYKVPVLCTDMSSTDNSKLYFKLIPNSIYRHFAPDYPNSNEWTYDEIITSLDSISNSESLPFSMNIDFNFTGDFWDYTLSSDEVIDRNDNLYGTPDDYDLDCIIEYERLAKFENVKYSELTNDLKAVINTGLYCDGDDTILGCWGLNTLVTCTFPVTPGVTKINDGYENDLVTAISMQEQSYILSQINTVEKKIQTKKFLTNNIVPMFAIILIIIFYAFELFMIGFVIFGIIPLMFNQFIKGLKDAFDIDPLIKRRGNK